MAPILPGIALDTGSYRLRVGRERTFLMPVGILEFVAHNPGNHGDVGWQDSSEDTHPRSLGALGLNWSSPLRCAYPVAGRTGLTTTATLSGTRRSRIWCETDMDAYAGAINSVWQSAGMAVDECETADYSGLTKGEAVAAVGGYSGGLALLVLILRRVLCRLPEQQHHQWRGRHHPPDWCWGCIRLFVLRLGHRPRPERTFCVGSSICRRRSALLGCLALRPSTCGFSRSGMSSVRPAGVP